MDKKVVLLGIVFLAVLIGGIVMLRGGKDTSSPASGIVFFYGEGCPHCANVETYMQENDVESKLEVTKKEVYLNEENSAELAARAEMCKIPESDLGVPLLWDGSDCIQGDESIIAFFKDKLGSGE